MANLKADQRIFPRKTLQTRVLFEDEFSEEFLYFLSTDLSASGLFIESSIHLQNRTKVFLKFSLQEGEAPIQVTGEVMRLMDNARKRGRKPKNRKLGIGIRFLGLRPEDLIRIEKFIES